jgi:peptidoglycan/LPS O-acetylase OafA/YrhL
VLLAELALWLDLRTCMALALALLLLLVSPGRLPGQPVAATRWLAWLGQRS